MSDIFIVNYRAIFSIVRLFCDDILFVMEARIFILLLCNPVILVSTIVARRTIAIIPNIYSLVVTSTSSLPNLAKNHVHSHEYM